MAKTIIDDKRVLAELILDGMDLSPYDYSSITDMEEMFNESNITYELLEKANLDTSNVTSINSMFGSCKNLTTIPLLDTSNVTDMSYVFNGCENLTSIPKLDTSKANNMHWMFRECSKLTTIPELDTSNVTDMVTMFYRCENLTSIPKLDTSNVTDMKYLFNGCKSLTTIPKLDTSKVSNTSYIFSRCSNLSLKSILLNKDLMEEFDDSIMNKYKNIISIDNIEDLDERKINILSKIFEE